MGGLRIAHLIETDGPGGAERVVAGMASQLQRAGAENVVILPARGEGWLAAQLERTGIAIEHFSLHSPVSPRCVREIAAALRRHRVDVAHSHEFSMAVYGAAAARLAGVPHVITMHGNRYYAGRFRRRAALRAAIAVSGATIAVSHRLADDLRRDLLLPRSRVAMISNGVIAAAPASPAPVRGELRLDEADRLLVAVGNLYPVKGHVHLIDAMALLAPRHPRLHVAICGRGDLRAELEARARTLGVAARVHLLGLRSDVAGVLAAADAFVLPSLSEGLPLALLEAMFAARPIVASAVGEIPAVLAHGDAGVLVEPGSAAALAEAIGSFLEHPDRARQLGERARRRALAEYDLATMIRRYSEVYERTLMHTRGCGEPLASALR
jgi:glycosyltransferase involved in cell wall biosynthesis